MLTEEQKSEIDKKSEYIDQKAKLLKEYKSYEINLEYADDEWEEDLIMQTREKLAAQIKALGAKIREIESWEAEA
jgi:diacylglycerol kinase family enzyme